MSFKQKRQARAKKQVATKAIYKFSPYDIILAPIVTEKAHSVQESNNKYTFKVHKDANKNDVRQAIKYLYNVDPKKVNIVNYKPKLRMQRGTVRRAYKKAIITLGKKDKIEVGS